MPPGDAAEAADWRTEMERMRTELSNAQSDNKRLEAELEQKKAMVADMSARVDEATQKIGQCAMVAAMVVGAALRSRIRWLWSTELTVWRNAWPQPRKTGD